MKTNVVIGVSYYGLVVHQSRRLWLLHHGLEKLFGFGFVYEADGRWWSLNGYSPTGQYVGAIHGHVETGGQVRVHPPTSLSSTIHDLLKAVNAKTLVR